MTTTPLSLWFASRASPILPRMRTSIGLFVLTLVAACGPQPGDTGDDTDPAGSSSGGGSGTSADGSTSGDTPTGDVPTGDAPTGDSGDETTGDTPPAGPCGQPQADVADFDLSLTINPPPGPDSPPVFVEADCTIDALLTTDVQDGLALRCPVDGADVILRAEYTSNHAPLPASVTVGLAVHVRYSTYYAESRQLAILVEAIADPRIILAANAGTGILPFVEGMGQLTEFWGPLTVSELASGCAGMPGGCTTEIQRSGLSLGFGDQALDLFDHQVGQLGPHTVQLGSVIRELSADNFCDGGSDRRDDFLVVHD